MYVCKRRTQAPHERTTSTAPEVLVHAHLFFALCAQCTPMSSLANPRRDLTPNSYFVAYHSRISGK